MATTPFDSALHARLFDAGEIGRLFNDSAEIRAMLIVEGTLARAQAAAGVIPEVSAAAIHRAAMEVQIDPAALAGATGRNGVSVPGLVQAFRDAMQAPEHAQYIHWGATSQDIMDTGLMLRLRQALSHAGALIDDTLAALARLAEDHAETPIVARTYGQHATPSSFGAIVSGWGAPLLTLARELDGLRQDGLPVSLSGAAGTGAQLGPDPAAIRAELARALDLTDPGRSWHSDRQPILRLSGWMARVLASLGKMGEDLILMTQPELAELRLGQSGGSSTMPQKQNPVQPSVLVALGRHGLGLEATIAQAALHRQARDGAAWFTEWLTLPQLCTALGAALTHAAALSATLTPAPARMTQAFDIAHGTLFAEALSFALARRMPRPEAQATVKDLCRSLPGTGQSLRQAANARFPDLPATVFEPAHQLGTAPAEARAFARSVRDRT